MATDCCRNIAVTPTTWFRVQENASFAPFIWRTPESALFGCGLIGVSELYSSDAHLSTAYRVLMHPQTVMTSHTGDSPSVSEFCTRVNQRVESATVERREK